MYKSGDYVAKIPEGICKIYKIYTRTVKPCTEADILIFSCILKVIPHTFS